MNDAPNALPTVATLMTIDPLKLSAQDLDRIIESLRASRKKFVQGSLTAGKPEAKKSKTQLKEEAALQTVGKLDLSSLGL